MMALAPYTIETVDPAWALDSEEMGSKRKFWYLRPGRGLRPKRLFKYPLAGSGEHWAEKVAAEVGKAIGVSCARVTLAECGGERGTSTWLFVKKREQLFHGNQVMAGALDNYDKGLCFG